MMLVYEFNLDSNMRRCRPTKVADTLPTLQAVSAPPTVSPGAAGVSHAPERRQSHLHCKKADRSPETNLRFADRPRGSRALWRTLAKALKGARSFDLAWYPAQVWVRFLVEERDRKRTPSKNAAGAQLPGG